VKEFDNAWHDANNNVLVSFFLELETFPSNRCRFSTSELVDIFS
jgi:hypothetical protein